MQNKKKSNSNFVFLPIGIRSSAVRTIRWIRPAGRRIRRRAENPKFFSWQKSKREMKKFSGFYSLCVAKKTSLGKR